MKNIRNLCLLLSGVAAFTALLTGCVKDPNNTPDIGGGNDGSDKFDYATTVNARLNVDYSMKGNKALFEVYAENPVIDKEGVPVRKQGVNALLKAYTDQNCSYSGVVDLPIGTETIYLYSENYGLPTCVSTEVTANGVSFNFKEYRSKLTADKGGSVVAKSAGTRAYSTANPYNIQMLGTWDSNGSPSYVVGEVYGGYLYPVCVDLPSGLLNRIQNVLLPGSDNIQYAKPTKFVNFDIIKDTDLTLTFVSEQAAWRNAIGYYYYDTKNPPKTQEEFDRIAKYISFPNCSMFCWDSDSGFIGNYNPPLNPGEQIKLVYFDQNGKKSQTFPKGTTVGWFILPDGFEMDDAGIGTLDITGSKHGIRYSNNEFNADEGCYMVCMNDESGKTILGFEDSGDGVGRGDYKDVLVYVDAGQADAIADPERPDIGPDDEKYPDIVGDPIFGTLAFEDLWPSQGDYDMNDVVVTYNTTFTTDKENRIVAITDVFTPVHAGGQVKSAFGYQLDLPATAIKNLQIENGSSTANTVGGLELQQPKAVVMLFDDIKQAVVRGPITVTIELMENTLSMNDVSRKTLYNPFICVSDKGFVPGVLRKEIHLTNYAPTALADPYPFGRNDDKSPVDKNGNPIGPYYYVTSDLHPFAIDLPVIGYRIPDERVKIDDFYPDFTGWVTSKGEQNKTWYLRVAK